MEDIQAADVSDKQIIGIGCQRKAFRLGIDVLGISETTYTRHLINSDLILVFKSS